MYCPDCGTETSPDRKFCRSCGLALEPVSQLLAGRPQERPSATNSVEPAQSERRRMLRWGFITLWIGLLLAAFFGILGGALSSIGGELGGFVASLAGLGGLVLFVGIGLMLYSLFLPKAPGDVRRAAQAELPQPNITIDMPPQHNRRPVVSVTENTTELLDEPKPRAQDESSRER